MHLQFVLQYASDLYCSAFGATELSGKGSTSVLLPLECNPIYIAICPPFVSQYFWENLGGCGHQDVP